MDFVDLVKVLVPVRLSLPNLESIKPGACLLVFLETAHEVFGGSGYQEVGNPQHVVQGRTVLAPCGMSAPS